MTPHGPLTTALAQVQDHRVARVVGTAVNVSE
jgi:hypothetical protein